MTGARFARVGWVLLAITSIGVWYRVSRLTLGSGSVPSLQDFFQQLVNHYNPSAVPSFEVLTKVENLIPGAGPEEITAALPAIFKGFSHQDERVRLYSASALFAISRRTDSA